MTLLPTLNRLSLLQRFLDSAIECETSTPGLIIVDRNDYEKHKEKYESLRVPKEWKLTLTEAVKMGDKIREVWPQVKDSSWVNLLNDDHVIKTKEWDKKLISKLDGTNFVTCNDNWMSPRKAAGATVFSMKLLETVGIPIYPNGMQHLFIDDLWEGIGRATGCWEIDHSVLIEHHNQLKTPDRRDDTFHEVYGRGPDMTQHPLWQHDYAVYQNFIRLELLQTRNKIRVLRGQLPIE